MPWELMEKLCWVYGAAVVRYCGKAGYENKCKIGQGKGRDGK